MYNFKAPKFVYFGNDPAMNFCSGDKYFTVRKDHRLEFSSEEIVKITENISPENYSINESQSFISFYAFYFDNIETIYRQVVHNITAMRSIGQ